MPFNFTDKDMGYKKLLQDIRKLGKGKEVFVGIRAEKGVEPVKGSDFNLAGLAVAMEFGTEDGHIPARPHYRPTVDEGRQEYLNDLQKGVTKAIFNGSNIVKEFKKIGAKVSGDVKKRIKAGIKPDNAPSTIAAKGSSKPLIDTGRYWQTIDYEVAEVK